MQGFQASTDSCAPLSAPRRSPKRVVFFAALGVLGAISCAVRPSGATATDAQTFAYATAATAYSRGDFASAAKVAAEAGDFLPALVLRGKALYFQGDHAAAEAVLANVLEDKPSSVEAGLFLARVHRKTGKADEARRLVERILADDPADLRALRLASELAEDSGDAASAAAFLDRADEASGEAALVFLDRARLRWRGGDGEGAAADLRRVPALAGEISAATRAARELLEIVEGEVAR